MGTECLARVQRKNSNHFWQDHKWQSTFHLSLVTLLFCLPKGDTLSTFKDFHHTIRWQKLRQVDRGQFLKSMVAQQLFNMLCVFLPFCTDCRHTSHTHKRIVWAQFHHWPKHKSTLDKSKWWSRNYSLLLQVIWCHISINISRLLLQHTYSTAATYRPDSVLII